MSKMIIGIDIDGVLANFNKSLRDMLIRTSGRDLIPEFEVSGNTIDTTPPTWFYPSESYGYTKLEESRALDACNNEFDFWENLEPYPQTLDFLKRLYNALDEEQGDEVYFLTTREGPDVKGQTERWIRKNCAYRFDAPTILIARGDKGGIARGLGLTHFLDDRPKNCQSVRQACPECIVVMPLTRYNREYANGPASSEQVRIVHNILEFVDSLERIGAARG